MLFATFENNAHFIIFLVLMVVGFGKIGTWLKGNPALRKGLFWIIFRK